MFRWQTENEKSFKWIMNAENGDTERGEKERKKERLSASSGAARQREREENNQHLSEHKEEKVRSAQSNLRRNSLAQCTRMISDQHRVSALNRWSLFLSLACSYQSHLKSRVVEHEKFISTTIHTYIYMQICQAWNDPLSIKYRWRVNISILIIALDMLNGGKSEIGKIRQSNNWIRSSVFFSSVKLTNVQSEKRQNIFASINKRSTSGRELECKQSTHSLKQQSSKIGSTRSGTARRRVMFTVC